MKEKTNCIYIVIVNYNSSKVLLDCLESLRKNPFKDYKVVVVDNKSKSSDIQILKDNVSKDIIFLQARYNGGFSVGNNIGIKVAMEAGARYIMLLNPDIIIKQEKFFPILLESIERRKDIGILGPKMIRAEGGIDLACARTKKTIKTMFFSETFLASFFPNNKVRKKYYYNFFKDIESLREVGSIKGACMLIKREVFVKTGLLDEKVFLYSEEPILSIKAREIGLKTFVEPKAEILHLEKKSTGTGKIWLMVELYKSEYYLFKKYKKSSFISLLIVKTIRTIEFLVILILGKSFEKNNWQRFFTEYLFRK